MASRSADLQNSSSNISPEEQLFGRPYAYYKPEKSSVSSKLVVAALIVVVVAALDFLLATNILIYIRTIEPGSTKDAVRHTAVILMSLALIWVSYRFMVWYIKKFKIKDSMKQNKFYQRIANEVIELENLLQNPEDNDKRTD
ncbi:putative membrane protein [Wickerhamomyces ciferrii]|uniref:Membrane protein n=1 Tax=Wickerhamomyces ciferrii (strain ATCC 14091 / BCRC 22168 / CBS 111 / JCM 3599 / NBRC 0793 / NRRL Y-1031 F-60-10) TaxID=1206466 RepID=K0KHX6_WICCF|nr:uncharacterized protein BN7_2170 [Wickerhamomyces ciferrii]CCH42626.1 putative membrane protein [Wickerhamomyces ciferrii]